MKAKELYRMPEDYVTRRNDTEYGLLETFEYESTTTGTTRKANIILPAGYDESKQYPILYLLHGIGGDRNEWLGADPVTVVGNLIAMSELGQTMWEILLTSILLSIFRRLIILSMNYKRI